VASLLGLFGPRYCARMRVHAQRMIGVCACTFTPRSSTLYRSFAAYNKLDSRQDNAFLLEVKQHSTCRSEKRTWNCSSWWIPGIASASKRRDAKTWNARQTYTQRCAESHRERERQRTDLTASDMKSRTVSRTKVFGGDTTPAPAASRVGTAAKTVLTELLRK